MKVYGFDEKKTKKIEAGEFNSETFVFRKEVLQKHWVRKYRGFGISGDVLSQLKTLGCLTIEIKFGDTLKSVGIDKWATRVGDNLGSGFQVFYPWEKMNEVSSRQQSWTSWL